MKLGIRWEEILCLLPFMCWYVAAYKIGMRYINKTGGKK
jgi:hypothetical protein